MSRTRFAVTLVLAVGLGAAAGVSAAEGASDALTFRQISYVDATGENSRPARVLFDDARQLLIVARPGPLPLNPAGPGPGPVPPVVISDPSEVPKDAIYAAIPYAKITKIVYWLSQPGPVVGSVASDGPRRQLILVEFKDVAELPEESVHLVLPYRAYREWYRQLLIALEDATDLEVEEVRQ